MSFATRTEAVDFWKPESAVVLYDHEATVVYLYDWNLVILRVFATGFAADKWYVSVNVNKTIDELQELLM